MLALALLLASGPVVVDGHDTPPACVAADGAVLGAVAGAAAGVVVAVVVGIVAEAESPCRKPGVVCTDDLDALMAPYYAAVIAMPIGAALGAGLGGFVAYKSVAPSEAKPPPLEHAY